MLDSATKVTGERIVMVDNLNEDEIINDFDIFEIESKSDKETQTENENENKELIQKLHNELISQNRKIYALRQQIIKIKKHKFSYKNIKNDTKKFNFYTGISKAIFKWIFSIIKPKVSYRYQLLPEKDHLLLVLIKLKLGLMNVDLSYRFEISTTHVSRIYRRWLPIIAGNLKFLLVWPERGTNRDNMPTCFKRNYRNCVAVIDCTEVFIERPLNLNARAQTWSNYKNHNTIKYLIAISPSGVVSFLSEGWGGRVSDREITLQSGFLEKIEHGDLILADRGFTISMELATRGASLEIPAFTRGKTQLSGREVDRSRKIANVRIHIERIIGRLRKFNIINTSIPISQVTLLDDVMVVVCALVNLNQSVIPS